LVEVRDILVEHPAGLTRAELLAIARERINPDLAEGQLDAELEMLEGEIVEENGRIRLIALISADPPPAWAVVAETSSATPAPAATLGLATDVAAGAPAFRRLVAIDLESVLRYTEKHPDGERTIFQIGAARFGADAEWVSAATPFNRFIRLPDALRERIVKTDIRERIDAEGDDPLVVLSDFLGYIGDAEAIVAYNGRSFDFRLIDEALDYHLGRAIPPRIERIDALYLALAVWPVPPRRHTLSRLINDERFEAIRERLAIDLTGLVAHDAAHDCQMLIDLIRFAAAEVEDWPADKQALVRSAGGRSNAWRMLFSFVAGAPPVRSFDLPAVRAAISAALEAEGKAPLRVRDDPDNPPAPAEIDVRALRAADGTIDIDALVRSVKGENARVRASQRDMVSAMRGWVAAGIDALVEAPTGTGKSYAILAVALEWLAADPANRVVISTYTRALQRQMANDIYELHEAGVIPGLISQTSLIKGSTNRLSLAGLVRALADCTNPPKISRRRGDFLGHPLFAELALYLALRLMTKGTPVEEWEAHSVDPVDIEPFFESYLADRPGPRAPSRRGAFLRYLSQAESHDYRPGDESPAEHTSEVKEVLGRHRLLVTNHALLLRHLDDFSDATHTLMIVDEAHSLEAAATDALEAKLDYALVEEGYSELRDWIRPPAPDATEAERGAHAALLATLSRLEGFLEYENVPRFASRALDAAGRDLLHRDALRVVALASPVTRPVPPRDGFIHALEELARRLDGVASTLQAQPQREDRIEDERRRALIDRFEDLSGSAATIVADLLAVVEPAADVLIAATAPNRVIWLDEQPRRGPRPRDFRFGVTSSPIELSREPLYGKLIGSFARSYYISATLQVDGSFAFIRRRLALPDARVREIELASPFDLEHQAKLVCFTDFPSWTEQEQAAIRSVAQQVGRFLGEVSRGTDNGAMVLTTSRNAANEIYEQLIGIRGSLEREYAISSAGYLGAATAIEEFKLRGGALVGTKGLWQGVDIDDARLLRLVWINKLPFAPFGDPVIAARRETIRAEAEAVGVADPDGYAVEHYYLPLAAMELRQAVGRLIRSGDHRGVVVISDRKLAGPTRLHHRYRQVFLGSLTGLVRDDAVWGTGGGNLRSMAEGWREIWDFLAADGAVLTGERAAALSDPTALEELTLLPSVREIRGAAMTPERLAELRAAGPEAVYEDLVERARTIGRNLSDKFVDLFDYQAEALAALATERDILAILPTSAGKSFIYQLPAFALPGVTIVVSPLVALMTDQALALNRSAGGMVRALVAPMRESNSRTGKAQVYQQLTGVENHGIRLVYVSPERLCQHQFQEWILAGVEAGIVTRIAIDEAHTFATWGDDFRPAFKRAERFLARLRAHPRRPRLMALTATATPSVRVRLRRMIFGLEGPNPGALAEITRNPIRPELALYRKTLGRGEGGIVGKQKLLAALLTATPGHTIIYTLTIKEARALYAALIDELGETERDRLRLFHGKMTAAEKEAVAYDFVNAPKEGAEDYYAMIVVATAAFGLGVDRRDIRTVIVASPPGDLAALYQEIGRGGRDGKPATGIMLGSGRAFGMLAFMESRRRRLDPLRVARIAGPILEGPGPVDMDAIAADLIDEDVALHRLRSEEAEKEGTRGEYKTAVTRVFAALAEVELIEDRGDFPDRVKAIARDDAPQPGPEQAPFVAAVTAAIADAPGGIVEIGDLAAVLADGYPDEAGDPGDLWVSLLELHSLGYLDVSQQATRCQLSSIVRRGTTLPAGFADRFVSELARVERERLVGFFTRPSAPTCVNDDFRRYFEEPTLPEHTCDRDERRCSGCWLLGLDGGAGVPPPLYDALSTARARTHKSAGEVRAGQARTARHLEKLLRARWKPLAPFWMFKTLRGEDSFYSPRAKKMLPLYPELVNSAIYGAQPGLRQPDLDAALASLVASGQVTKTSSAPDLYRWSEHLRAEAARAERAAAAAARKGGMQQAFDLASIGVVAGATSESEAEALAVQAGAAFESESGPVVGEGLDFTGPGAGAIAGARPAAE
jgi:ATP-dependent DNA helicase RecQ